MKEVFFQPLLPLLQRHMEAACEAVSDDHAMYLARDRRAYARQLLHWAEWLPSRSHLGLAMNTVRLRSQLGRRINRILKSRPPQPTRLGLLGKCGITLAAVAVCLLSNTVFLAHTKAVALAGIAWIWCVC